VCVFLYYRTFVGGVFRYFSGISISIFYDEFAKRQNKSGTKRDLMCKFLFERRIPFEKIRSGIFRHFSTVLTIFCCKKMVCIRILLKLWKPTDGRQGIALSDKCRGEIPNCGDGSVDNGI